MAFVRYFFYIVGGALLSSVLGGIFAAVVAAVSPEFVNTLFGRPPGSEAIARYAAGAGMIWGLFLGTAVMGFSLFLVTLVQVARVIRKKADAEN